MALLGLGEPALSVHLDRAFDSNVPGDNITNLEVVDLVGAGDSFRAGLITYLASHLDDFMSGTINFAEAVQMGNLFASLFIKAPLDDRDGSIKTYDKMLEIVHSGITYPTFDALQKALD